MVKKKTQERAENTRSKILDAYIALCAEIGITSVTLQKVAKKAKIAFATVRYHFAEQGVNLEYEAALHVAQSGQRFTQKSIDEARGDKKFDGLKAYVETTFDWIETCPEQAKYLVYFYYLSGTKLELPIRNDSLINTARLRTAALLHENIGRGLIQPHKDVNLLAEKIHSIVFGSGVLAMSVATREEYGRQRRNAWEMITTLLVPPKAAKAR